MATKPKLVLSEEEQPIQKTSVEAKIENLEAQIRDEVDKLQKDVAILITQAVKKHILIKKYSEPTYDWNVLLAPLQPLTLTKPKKNKKRADTMIRELLPKEGMTPEQILKAMEGKIEVEKVEKAIETKNKKYFVIKDGKFFNK